jgi:rubrerythrin
MNDKNAKYIEILKLAKASENEAIRLYTLAMAYAPPEDLPKLAEILNDENDHDVIDTDLLFKAMTGHTAGQEELVPHVD